MKVSKRQASAGLAAGLAGMGGTLRRQLAKGLALPPEARRVVIAADPDDAGRKAARDAWIRWRPKGGRCELHVPDGVGDFNDLLMAREGNHVA